MVFDIVGGVSGTGCKRGDLLGGVILMVRD